LLSCNGTGKKPKKEQLGRVHEYAEKAWGEGFRSVEGRLGTWERLWTWCQDQIVVDETHQEILGEVVTTLQAGQSPTLNQAWAVLQTLQTALAQGFRRDE
jgi:hypothetical protein